MARKIFLSWQDDTNKSIGHYFLKDVLFEVCKQISADTELEEAHRDVEPDMDTLGVTGHALVVPTILKKIDEAAVFVADLTYTGTVANGRKATPNPNVLLEFGWAWKSIGGRIVAVMNAEFGHPEVERLPFDLAAARWPTFFRLKENASNKEIETEKRRFVPVLKQIVLEILKVAPPGAPEPQFVTTSAKHGISRFRAEGESIGVTWEPYSPFALNGHREVFLAKGPAIFLRLMPTKPIKQQFSAMELHSAAIQTGRLSLRPIVDNKIFALRAEDGVGICNAIDGDNRCSSAAFAFATGEVWSVDTSLLAHLRNGILSIDHLERELAERLSDYRDVLQRLNIQGPYRWSGGMEGVRGMSLTSTRAQPPMIFGGHPCMANELTAHGSLDGDQNPLEALQPLVAEICRKFALVRKAG